MLGSILRNAILMVVVVAGGAILLGQLSEMTPRQGAARGKTVAAAAARTPAPAPRSRAGDGDTLVIAPGEGGHYRVNAEINGNGIGMLVDTGATMVALSRRDAESIGIAVEQLDYSGLVRTASGTARVANVMLDEVALGDIRVRDVRAAVIDAPLVTSLLGMSFLSRLSGFSVEDGRLVLRR